MQPSHDATFALFQAYERSVKASNMFSEAAAVTLMKAFITSCWGMIGSLNGILTLRLAASVVAIG